MQYSDWLAQCLEQISCSCDEGREAVEYIRSRKIKVRFKRAQASVGAFWTIAGNINFNSIHHTYESTLKDPRAWTVLIHETRHLQQGFFKALSVYGELEAWQYEFRIYHKLTGRKLNPILEKLVELPLSWDRAILLRTRELMQEYAGKGYRIDLLPLYPFPQEVKYRLTRKEPVD